MFSLIEGIGVLCGCISYGTVEAHKGEGHTFRERTCLLCDLLEYLGVCAAELYYRKISAALSFCDPFQEGSLYALGLAEQLDEPADERIGY